jgi:glyoxylase-like metal-dependent hydrolase (beta-lactamase superfamily II)
MNRTAVLGTLVLVGAVAIAGAAAQAPKAQTIAVEKVRDNYYVLMSSTPGNADSFSGGNVGVFITANGVVLVDTKLAAWGDTFLATVKKVAGDRPVTTIINTHTHGDHTGNNDKFAGKVEFVAHENTKANMEKMDAFKGDKAKFLPTRTYKDHLTVGTGNDRIELHYFGAAHTNGDSFVVFPSLRVMQTGDAFAWKDGPRIDRMNGGSGVSYPDTLAKAAALAKNLDVIVPGHSPMMKPADLAEYARFTANLLAAAQAAHKAGRNVDAAAADAIQVASKFPGYGSERIKVAVTDIYDELNTRR